MSRTVCTKKAKPAGTMASAETKSKRDWDGAAHKCYSAQGNDDEDDGQRRLNGVIQASQVAGAIRMIDVEGDDAPRQRQREYQHEQRQKPTGPDITRCRSTRS